jgi:hypothetical protein
MYPAWPPKGFILCKKLGWAVDRSGSAVRRDQPMLLKEVRNADSFDVDISVPSQV